MRSGFGPYFALISAVLPLNRYLWDSNGAARGLRLASRDIMNIALGK